MSCQFQDSAELTTYRAVVAGVYSDTLARLVVRPAHELSLETQDRVWWGTDVAVSRFTWSRELVAALDHAVAALRGNS